MSCLTILYPAGPGITFDADYYRDHHLTLITGLYGGTIERFEMRRVVPPAPGAPVSSGGDPALPGGAAPFAAVINIWIADVERFRAANEQHGPTLVRDVPNFTNSVPTFQFDEVQGSLGAAREAMNLGDACLTILYPNEPDVRWDVEYYRTHHMPLIMQLYGDTAIRRFELRKGESAGDGGRPPFIGCINVYINDPAAFDAAGAQHAQALIDDVPNFSSVMPSAFRTVIHGLG